MGFSQVMPQKPVAKCDLDEICGQLETDFKQPKSSQEQSQLALPFGENDVIVPLLYKERSHKSSIKRESSPKTKKIIQLEDRIDLLEKTIKEMQHELRQVVKQMATQASPEFQQEMSYQNCIEGESDNTPNLIHKDSLLTFKSKSPKQITLKNNYSATTGNSLPLHYAVSNQQSVKESSFMPKLKKQPNLRNLQKRISSYSDFPGTQNYNEDSGSDCSNDDAQNNSKNIDIAFLYADVLVYRKKENILPLASEMTLSPDKMYDDIVEELVKTNKQFNILKRPLNRESLIKVLGQRPKVLFLNCHGDKMRVDGKLSSHFCFESVDQLALLEEFNERQLFALLRDHQCQVQLVVISACHSSNLGQQLSDAGIPVVVSINTSVKILEKAAYAFNKMFLDFLLAGHSPQQSFQAGKANVSSAGEDNNNICCCNHDHQDDCLWYKFKEKNGFECAHQLHTLDCLCYKNKQLKSIEHSHECAQFRNFHKNLVNQGSIVDKAEKQKNTELIAEKEDDPDFLKSPITHYDKVYKNKLCCCASTLPHDESQKFIIMGSQKDLDTPIFTEKRSSGKVIQILPVSPDKPLPNWLKDLSLLLDRNAEIHRIIQNLDSRQQIKKRFLQVHGSPYSGRKPIVFRAVRYILERIPVKFSDGTFLVDLETVDSVQAMIFKFSSDLKLAHPSPNLETLILDIEQRKMLILVTNCEIIKPSHDLHKETCDFFKKMITKTNDLKLILITEDAALNPFQSAWGKSMTWHCNIEVKPISRETKVKMFKIQIETENKMGLLKGVNVDSHTVFDLADNWFISRIVHQLSSKVSLDDIQADLQAQLMRKQSSKSNDQITQAKSKTLEMAITVRSLYCAEILNSVPVHYMLEKNLIFFLAQTPAGICYTEIQLLCNIYKSWFGTKFGGFLSELLIVTEAVQNQNILSGLTEADLANSCVVKKKKMELANSGLVIVTKNENINNENHYKVNIDQRYALNSLLDARSQNRKQLTNTSKTQNDFIAITIEFMGSIARAVLKNIRAKKRAGEVDHRLVTAHLDIGMWWRYTDEEYHLTISDHAEERFSSYYLTNFKSLLSQEVLELNFPNIWSIDKLSQESEFIFDLCLCVPSILAELNRFQEALEVINVCRKFGGAQRLLLHGYLDLMHASIQVYTDTSQEVTKLLQSARQTFEFFQHPEGIAEAYYVEALLNINQFNRNVQPSKNFSGWDSLSLQHYSSKIPDQNTIYQQKIPPILQSSRRKTKSYIQQNQLADTQEISDICLIGSDIATLVSCLTKAFEEFGRMQEFSGQEIQICNKIFGKAKTQMVKAEFFINHYTNLKEDQLDQFNFSRETCLSQLEEAEELFTRQNHFKYIAYCKCLQAKVTIAIKDVFKTRKSDLVNARAIIDQALKLSDQFHDEKIIKEIKEVKNQILHHMRAGSTNLFTFVKAWPIVEQIDGLVTPLGEFTRTKYELMAKIDKNFANLGKEIQVKYDLLTEDTLQYVAEFGSRVLHLTSDMFHKDYLYIEGEIGMCQRMGVGELREFLKKTLISTTQKKFPVDVVVLAIPESTDLGKVFQEFGVKHLVTFEFTKDFKCKSDEMESLLIPIRYNYMLTFCVEFYTALVEQCSVRKAFEKAVYAVEKNQQMQFELIWQHRDPFGELGIKPVLLDFENPQHNDQLFSSKAAEDDYEYLSFGKLIDSSKARGLLQNVERPTSPFIGHQKEMYNVLQWLIAVKPEVTHLVHVKGVRSVGKTRFLKEVAYYLYQRYKFESKIQYVDLLQIKTVAELQALLTQMKVFETEKGKQGQKDDREILLIFDNADSLPQEVFMSCEARLVELMSKNSSMRAIIASRRSLPFKTFVKPQTYEQLKNSKSMIGARRRYSLPQKKYWCQELLLNPLDDIHAVDLILNTCQKQMTTEYLRAENFVMTIHDLLGENVKKCKNLPLYLIEYANKLSKAESFQDVRVHTVSDDVFKYKTSNKNKQKTKVTFETIKNKSDDDKSSDENSDTVMDQLIFNKNLSGFDRRKTVLLQPNLRPIFAMKLEALSEVSESKASQSVLVRSSESETVDQCSSSSVSDKTEFQNEINASNQQELVAHVIPKIVIYQEEERDFYGDDEPNLLKSTAQSLESSHMLTSETQPIPHPFLQKEKQATGCIIY